MTPRFDAYSATVPRGDCAAIRDLVYGFREGGDTVRTGPGYHGFREKLSMRGDDGAEWGSVLWGGRAADLVMVEVKGERTPAVVEALREATPAHRCTRVDSCVDVEAAGAWDKLLPVVMDIKHRYDLRGERRGDWEYPEDGRTQYLGSPASAVRARMYEKGKQPEYRYLGRPDWVRVECQVRPEQDARTVYASASAVDVWGASPFTRDLAASVLEARVRPLPPYVARRQNERDRALAFMCRQYGPHLLSLMQDLGDWECVGKTLGAEVLAQRRASVKRRAS